MTGIYVLVIELDKDLEMTVGRKGVFRFPAGFYGYVGSALSGLENRLKRHLKAGKKLHWHIDYLLRKAAVRNIIYAATEEKKECLLAGELSSRFPAIDGFGCSDCRCRSHLFFSRDRAPLEMTAHEALIKLGLAPETSRSGLFKTQAADET